MEEIKMRTTPDQQLERAKAEGWIYAGDMATEGEVLGLIHALVRISKPEVCVETGTYTGQGTLAIQQGLHDNNKGHLWTIEKEPHEYPALDRVTFIHGDSVEWTGGDTPWSRRECPVDIDFAFVDCGPPEIRVQAFANLLPKMNEGGLILVHDTNFYESTFLEALSNAYGCPPTFQFPALNGVVGWQT
jgi:predicted O-methyltransferase YrrM